MHELVSWLRSLDGRRSARRWVARHGLPSHLAEDVSAEVVARTWSAVMAGQDIVRIEAWANRLGTFAAIDLARGRARRPLAAGPGVQRDGWADRADDGKPGEGLAHAGPAPLDVAVVASLARAVRRSLVGGRDAPWVVAAGLAKLAVDVDGAGPGPSCPLPGAGAAPSAASEWASLYYAGRDDCLPPDNAAVAAAGAAALRKRRSRAVHDVARALVAAATRVGIEQDV